MERLDEKLEKRKCRRVLKGLRVAVARLNAAAEMQRSAVAEILDLAEVVGRLADEEAFPQIRVELKKAGRV